MDGSLEKAVCGCCPAHQATDRSGKWAGVVRDAVARGSPSQLWVVLPWGHQACRPLATLALGSQSVVTLWPPGLVKPLGFLVSCEQGLPLGPLILAWLVTLASSK